MNEYFFNESDIRCMLKKADIGKGEKEYKRAKELIESMHLSKREKESALAIVKEWCNVLVGILLLWTLKVIG